MERLLVVCTANICRSPYVEARLRTELGSIAQASGAVTVESAGTRALTREPMAAETAALLRGEGIEVNQAHAARQIAPAMIARADLILVMTRKHRAQVLEFEPMALRRTLTLREFAGVLRAEPISAAQAEQVSWAQAAQHVLQRRSAHPQLVNSEWTDLADPYGGDAAAFERMAREVDEALAAILSGVYPGRA